MQCSTDLTPLASRFDIFQFPFRFNPGTNGVTTPHTTAAMTALHTKATMRQRRAGARKRLEEETVSNVDAKATQAIITIRD
jgi:hypothetical protein